MEIKNAIGMLKKVLGIGIAVFLLACCTSTANAQVYKIKDGRMFIEVDKNISIGGLDSFIIKYDLGDLAIGRIRSTGKAGR